MSLLSFADAHLRKLAKLTIIPVANEELNSLANLGRLNKNLIDISKIKTSGSAFEVLYNPKAFKRNYALTLVDLQTTNPAVPPPVANTGKENGTMSFEFIFDATGASPTSALNIKNKIETFKNSFDGVEKEIKEFLKTVYSTNKDGHSANPVIIVWGPNFFAGQFKSVSINYTLFDRQGKPLRATVNAEFVEDDRSKNADITNVLRSPDVTKTYTVKAGDTLTLLAKEMYDDESLYLEIARINQLRNYRKLTPGKVLVFPPIKKEDL
ncbi:MAG: LysM peptidoglycan-binding domain-containing protein [Bacteroidia bacterium]|jgi:hypothetical protein|nr:LysM peptidoglycan-binding domain-containing protein [Bacteroidia bacterium]